MRTAEPPRQPSLPEKRDHSAYHPDICKYRPAGALEGDQGLAKETLTSVFGSIRFAGSATPT
jgi:hypothetical protein